MGNSKQPAHRQEASRPAAPRRGVGPNAADRKAFSPKLSLSRTFVAAPSD
jgi:hypothetical protein